MTLGVHSVGVDGLLRGVGDTRAAIVWVKRLGWWGCTGSVDWR